MWGITILWVVSQSGGYPSHLRGWKEERKQKNSYGKNECLHLFHTIQRISQRYKIKLRLQFKITMFLRRKQKILRDIKVSGENCAKLPQMEQGLQGEFEKYSNMIMNRNITFRGGCIK